MRGGWVGMYLCGDRLWCFEVVVTAITCSSGGHEWYRWLRGSWGIYRYVVARGGGMDR